MECQHLPEGDWSPVAFQGFSQAAGSWAARWQGLLEKQSWENGVGLRQLGKPQKAPANCSALDWWPDGSSSPEWKMGAGLTGIRSRLRWGGPDLAWTHWPRTGGNIVTKSLAGASLGGPIPSEPGSQTLCSRNKVLLPNRITLIMTSSSSTGAGHLWAGPGSGYLGLCGPCGFWASAQPCCWVSKSRRGTADKQRFWENPQGSSQARPLAMAGQLLTQQDHLLPFVTR